MDAKDLEKVLFIMGPSYKFWPEHSKQGFVFTHEGDDERAVCIMLPEGINALSNIARDEIILGRCNNAKTTLFEAMLTDSNEIH